MSITRLFPEAAGNKEIEERLIDLSVSFSQSDDDFFAKWEAFAIKQNDDIKVTDPAALDAFQTHLEKGARSSQIKKPKLMPRQLRGDPLLSKLKQETKLEYFTDDAPGSSAHILHGFQSHICRDLDAQASAGTSFNINTDISQFNKERPFNMQLRSISSELDSELEKVVESLMAVHGLQRSDFVNPHQISQSVGWTVGRIVREPPQLKSLEEADEYWKENQVLDPKSLLIESSRRIGGGSRTQLDFGLVPKAIDTTFEGKIIAAKGTNPKGEQFIVREVVDLPKLPVARVTSSKRGEGPVRVAVAAAPSTVQGLEMFSTWVGRNLSQGLSAIILIGPLLDSEAIGPEKPLVEEKSAAKDVLTKLSRAIQIPIVLVPSPTDVFTLDPLFPQPPYPDSELLVDQPLIRVSNPCTFSIDELAITVAANSSLKDMHLNQTGDAVKEILRQKRLYPVYPSPPSINVDYPHLNLANLGAVAPNMLIIPSATTSTECGLVDDVVYLAIGKLDDGFAVINVAGGEKPLTSRIGIDVLKLD